MKQEGGLRTKGIFKRGDSKLPLISIFTIVRNGEKHIEQTIQSVINQTYGNIEYIVLDAASTDSTVDIIKNYAHAIDYWVSEPDKGIADGMNKGIGLCTGDYVGMIHADDWYSFDTIDLVVKSNASKKADVICGLMQMWDGDKKTYLFDSQPSLLKKAMSINHPTCFISKKAYEKYGKYLLEFKYGMDYELLLRFLAQGASFNSISSVLANMRSGGNSSNLNSVFDGQRARKKHIPNSFYASQVYFLYDYFKAFVGFWLQKAGLVSLLKIYRKYFAMVKKY